MNSRICYLALGSNANASLYIPKARQALSSIFPDIRYAPEQETVPIGLSNPAPFLNQVARFTTTLSIEEVRAHLKSTELQCKNPPKDKVNEQIYIDIDLLSYEELLLKEGDWNRYYIQEGITFLLNEHDA